MKKTKHDLLIEIGTEEMPANYLAYAADPEHAQFEKKFREAFAALDKRGSYTLGPIQVYLTPRRIVWRLPRIAFSPEPIKEAVYGPSVKSATTPDGKPSKALQGFMKSKGISHKQLVEFNEKGRHCMGFWRQEKPPALKSILGDLLRDALKRMSFPKLMSWDDSDLRFPRPIRNCVCLVDGKPVRFRLGNITSGNTTLVFKQGTRRSFTVKSISDYFRILKSKGVLLEADLRRKKIEQRVAQLAKKHGGRYTSQAELLEEVTYLTEDPVCVSGSFDASFTDLPREVLTSSLAKGQRLFSVTNAAGEHLPFFVGVLDGEVRQQGSVVATMAAILRAKLQDSRFFYDEDMKVYGKADGRDTGDGIRKLKEHLDHLMYLKGMGSVADKVDRMKRVARDLAESWGLKPQEVKELESAIAFCKVDLLTHMVGEFPELEGVMGSIYYTRSKNASGGNQPIADAIREHYLPRTAEGVIPGSRIGAALAILDKADLIAACFAMGKTPSASFDPYALKRSLNGIFRIATHHGLDITWNDLILNILDRIARAKYIEMDKRDEVAATIGRFYDERLRFYFENQFEEDLVAAVLGAGSDRILPVMRKLKALNGIRQKNFFIKTLKIVQRTTNILKAAEAIEKPAVDPKLFKEDLERDLYEALQKSRAGIESAAREEDYAQATRLYANAFSDILHVFFEKVLVNVEDMDLRRNRLALLQTIRSLYVRGVADLSRMRIPIEREV